VLRLGLSQRLKFHKIINGIIVGALQRHGGIRGALELEKVGVKVSI
jgi:hypothetical protein